MAIYKAVVAWAGGIKTGLYEGGEAIEADGAQEALEIAEGILAREDPPDAAAEVLTVMNVEDTADMASVRFQK
jgi:hypothetical protein